MIITESNIIETAIKLAWAHAKTNRKNTSKISVQRTFEKSEG